MAASFQFSESNGAGESVTDGITNLNFGVVDSPNLTSPNNRIVAGNNSYEKYIRGKFSGTYTEISNMKFWKNSGAYVTDEVINAIANQDYAQPVTIASSKAVSAIPTVEGSALSLNSYEDESVIEFGASDVSGYTDYLVLQLQTSESTPAGAASSKQFTLSYDEI